MKKPLVASALVFSIFLSLSSPSASQIPGGREEQFQNVEKQQDNSDPVKNRAWEIVTEEAVFFFAGGIASVGIYFKYKFEKFKKNIGKKSEEITRNTLDSLKRVEPLKENEKRNSITIVGIGGTGKTTLINKMFDQKADPEIATRAFQTHFSVKEICIHSVQVKFKYYVTDYMGQNIGSLIHGMMQEQKIPYSPMTWGAINSIIFLVDVAEPPDSLGMQQQVYWEKRVRRHIREWSPTALDAIFGLVDQKKLQYVCLLVNKFDLLQNISEQQVKLEYKELIDEITLRCRGVYFECLVGSIYSEYFRHNLEKHLEKYSYSKEKSQ